MSFFVGTKSITPDTRLRDEDAGQDMQEDGRAYVSAELRGAVAANLLGGAFQVRVLDLERRGGLYKYLLPVLLLIGGSR